ncbi:85/88 kDa calcium-independent phospholipase A2-like [Tetranychus urticae]|uniref:phospholipase A2 n=1 Tax=Tetranychus urticae TaxID=32264 RepID=T1L2G8_TETUR|nr:85/88 kDa calcium-independent phospholipase A2-like [Tetranychus urticae]
MKESSKSSSIPGEREIIFRSDDYIKKCKIIKSKGQVLLVSDQMQTDYQIIVYKGSSGGYAVFITKEEAKGGRIFDRLSDVFDNLTRFIIYKSRSRIIRLLKMIVDTSLAHWDWKWIHVAAHLDMCNVFNVPIPESLLNDNENLNRQTPLLIAIKANKIDMVKIILTCKPNLTLVDIHDDTCLHLTALGPTNLLRLVLKECHHYHGLSLIEKANNLGHTPFHLACYHEKTANVNEFLKIGLSIRLLTLGKCDIEITGELLPEQSDLDYQPSSMSVQSKSETIVIFNSDMLNNLDVDESKHGGSPLHWCKRRKLMSLLIDYGFTLDVVNLLNETPLFSMIRKQRLDCMLPLLNAGASVDIYGPEGQTPLNFAIEKGFRDCFQALIVFDCDFNFPNKKKATPRHFAAQNILPIHSYMLHVLNKLGALRCNPNFNGCKDGCLYNGSFNGQPDTDQPTISNKHFYFDRIAKVANQEAETKSSETPDLSKKVNMLCIDGGGMKGLFGIQSMIEIQKLLDKPLIDYFDWIGATSTGAIIASSLIIGKSLKQLRADYFELKDEIFNSKRPHNTEALERVLKKYVGSDRKISSISWKKLMITSILADRDPPRLHLFRTYKPSIDLNEPFTMEGESSKSMDDFNLWEAIRASSAAPVFFKPYGPFIDGGLLSNNPTLDCLTEFFNCNPANSEGSNHESYSDKRDDSETIQQKETLNLVLSIGNGKPHPTSVVNFDYGNMAFRRNPVGVFRSAFKYITLGELMVKLATHPDNHVVQRSRAWCKSLNVSYYRLSPPLREKLKLDETQDEKIIDGMLQSKIYIYTIKDEITNLLTNIKARSS